MFSSVEMPLLSLRNGTPKECSRSQTSFLLPLVWNQCLRSFGTSPCWRSLLMVVRWCVMLQPGTFITERTSGKTQLLGVTFLISVYWK